MDLLAVYVLAGLAGFLALAVAKEQVQTARIRCAWLWVTLAATASALAVLFPGVVARGLHALV